MGQQWDMNTFTALKLLLKNTSNDDDDAFFFSICIAFSTNLEYKEEVKQPVYSSLQSRLKIWHLFPLAGLEGKQLQRRWNNNTQKTSACAGWGHWHAWLCISAGFHKGHMAAWICWGAREHRAQSLPQRSALPSPCSPFHPTCLSDCLSAFFGSGSYVRQTRTRLSEQLFVWVHSLLLGQDGAPAWLLSWGRQEEDGTGGPQPYDDSLLLLLSSADGKPPSLG